MRALALNQARRWFSVALLLMVLEKRICPTHELEPMRGRGDAEKVHAKFRKKVTGHPDAVSSSQGCYPHPAGHTTNSLDLVGSAIFPIYFNRLEIRTAYSAQ